MTGWVPGKAPEGWVLQSRSCLGMPTTATRKPHPLALMDVAGTAGFARGAGEAFNQVMDDEAGFAATSASRRVTRRPKAGSRC